MDRALQQALFASFAQPRAAPSHGSGRVTVTRTITRPSGHSTTTRHTRDYGHTRSSNHYHAPVQRSSHAASSFHSVAAPVVRSGGGGRTFDSYRHETARRHAAGARSSRRPDTNGRFNRLERDGIRPTPTTGRHAGVKRTSSKSRNSSGSSRSSRRIPTPKRPLVTGEGETFRPLGSGWVERTIDGEWVRSGLHTQMEADTQNWYIATYEPTSSHAQPGVAAVEEGMVNIEIAIKSTRPSDPGPEPASVFHIVVGYKSPRNFYMVVGDVLAKEWRIEHADGTVLSRVADTSMKQDIFFNLVILLRGSKISVDANGTSVFGRVMVPEGGLRGDIGVACRDSKLVFKGLRVSPAPGSKAASMVVKKSPRPHESDVVVRSGSGSGAGGAGAGSRMEVKTVHGRRAGSSSGYGGVSSSGYGAPSGGSSRGRKHEDRPVRTPPSSIPTNRPRFTDDDPRLIEMIERNVLECDIGVTFEDIAALDDAKRLLNEAVVLPLLVPEFFTGIREPWKGVLLFGPPGTGKTMLAKAVAGMNGTVFFNVSAATLVSKWRGESEKLVQCLFNMARHYAPSIIFIDEIDCLVTQRGTSSEHEASRRLKTQFLTQMDGITSKSDSGMVMVLATSNTPWDLDEALRRRLEKRIHIPLPGLEARTQMFSLNLKDVPTEDNVSPEVLAAETDGYSGADIHLVCREASMMGMRRLLLDKTPQDIQHMRNEGKLTSPPVSANDLKAAISRTRPSVSAEDTARFEEWGSMFGST